MDWNVALQDLGDVVIDTQGHVYLVAWTEVEATNTYPIVWFYVHTGKERISNLHHDNLFYPALVNPVKVSEVRNPQ